MTRINSTNLFGLSDFIVDKSGALGSYLTVQSAIDAAFALGSPGIVYIKTDGTAYVENLTLRDNVSLIGVCADGRDGPVVIQGSHTVPDGATTRISNLSLTTGGGLGLNVFNCAPVASTSSIEIKNCQIIAGGGRCFFLNASLAGSIRVQSVQNICFAASDVFVCFGDTQVTCELGSYQCMSPVDQVAEMNDVSQIEFDGSHVDANGSAFLTAAGTRVVLSACQVISQSTAFTGPLGGTYDVHNCIIICNDASGDFVTGSPSFNYSDLTLTGSARNINGTVGDFPATWKPFATAGTSVTAVRGTAGFDNTNFTMVDGLVSALNPVLSAQVTLTSAQVKALRATPVEIIPAVGVGKTPFVFFARLKLAYGGTNPFTNPQNLNFQLNNGAGTNILEGVLGTGFIDQSADMYQDVMMNAGNKIDTATSLDNASVVLHNVGASEITGNAANDNTLVVTVVYRILTQ